MKFRVLFVAAIAAILAGCGSALYKAESGKPCAIEMQLIKGGEYQGTCKDGLAHGEGIVKAGSVTYEGDFAEGYPHGEGTMTWNNGTTYKGEFSYGKYYGFGVYKSDEETKKGFWQDDELIVATEDDSPYDVIRNRRIKRYRIRKLNNAENTVDIRFKRGGSSIYSSIRNMQLQQSSGQQRNDNDKIRIADISLPFEGQLKYNPPNPNGMSTIESEFVFEIIAPGHWEIELMH
ncbi:MAG: hypothetical protein ACQETE_05535 [Bacteroidota bacterium]